MKAQPEQLLKQIKEGQMQIKAYQAIVDAKKELLEKYWDNFYKTCLDRHDPFEKYINDIYNKEICVSTLKSLSVHFTNINSSYGLSPFIDYKKLWDENK